MNTTDNHYDVPPYVPGGRLRQRHIINAIVDASAGHIEKEAVAEMLGVIDEFVADLVRAGEVVHLPRIGRVTEDMLGSDWHVGPVDSEGGHYPPVDVEVAEDLGTYPTLVAQAFNVISQLLDEAAPDAAVWVPGVGYHGPEEAIMAAQREDLAAELERLSSAGTSIWLLQCNPAKFDIFSMLDNGEVPSGWAVRRYVDDVREGDWVVFWISDEHAGVYALGEVVGPPQTGTPDPDHTGDDALDWDTFVPIDLTVDLWDIPILRSELKADERFVDESIIKVPAAANPQPLSVDAFEAILDRIGR